MKRFIAGASCPECHTTDTLFFETSEAEDRVHCSRCTYSEVRATEITPSFAQEQQEQHEQQESEIKWH